MDKKVSEEKGVGDFLLLKGKKYEVIGQSKSKKSWKLKGGASAQKAKGGKDWTWVSEGAGADESKESAPAERDEEKLAQAIKRPGTPPEPPPNDDVEGWSQAGSRNSKPKGGDTKHTNPTNSQNTQAATSTPPVSRGGVQTTAKTRTRSAAPKLPPRALSDAGALGHTAQKKRESIKELKRSLSLKKPVLRRPKSDGELLEIKKAMKRGNIIVRNGALFFDVKKQLKTEKEPESSWHMGTAAWYFAVFSLMVALNMTGYVYAKGFSVEDWWEYTSYGFPEVLGFYGTARAQPKIQSRFPKIPKATGGKQQKRKSKRSMWQVSEMELRYREDVRLARRGCWGRPKEPFQIGLRCHQFETRQICKSYDNCYWGLHNDVNVLSTDEQVGVERNFQEAVKSFKVSGTGDQIRLQNVRAGGRKRKRNAPSRAKTRKKKKKRNKKMKVVPKEALVKQSTEETIEATRSLQYENPYVPSDYYNNEM